MNAQTVAHVFRHVHMRKKCVALENRIDGTLFRRQVGDIFSVQNDAALIGRFQTGNDAQGCRFAAARRAEQRDEFAAGNVKGDIAKDVSLAEILGNML